MSATVNSEHDAAFTLPSCRGLYLLTAGVAALVAADLLCWWLGYEQLRSQWGLNLSLLAAVLGGARIIYGAVVGLWEGDVGTDLALAIALLAALTLGEYWVGAEVILIALVGESLESLTYARTHRELRKLLELRPRSVHVRRDEQIHDVALDAVQVGEVVVVRPGERLPVDGTVLGGRSAVDQSTLSGESVPVDKGPGDAVFAGTLNQFGALEVRADEVGAGTTLGQVIRLVAQARRNKAHIERIADRLARLFLPGVLALAAGTWVATNYEALRGSATGAAAPWAWMPTLAVLVVTCPCALILATPAAMVAALAWLARRGVLITGGAALERLAGVTRWAFDKTGTLTAGQLQLGDCLALGEGDAREVLRLAATAEQGSEHLIGQVIVRAAHDQALTCDPVAEFQALPGAGVVAQVRRPAEGTQALFVGNRRLMEERAVAVTAEADAALQRLEAAAQTPLLVAVDGRIVGALGVRDTIRPEAADVVAQLRQLGIEQLALLTGDRRAAAAHVAQAVGIARYAAELRPEEKARWLAEWCDEPAATAGSGTRGPATPAPRRPREIHVAMVGDGINDAPALAIADVGLALGGMGSDLTAAAGDVILMGDPLQPLPGLLQLSRATVRIIRQNIVLFAFGVNFLGIALTAWMMPRWSPQWMARAPVAAAVFHQVGSLLVLLNSLRLLWFERWHTGWLARLEGVAARASGCLLGWWPRCRETWVGLWEYRGPLLRLAGFLLLAAYLTQVVAIVQPDEVAVVQRYGRVRAVLPPGPHLRLPPPWETVTRQQPQRIRTLTIGLRRGPTGPAQSRAAIEWNTPHLGSTVSAQADQALVLTGDQSLVELTATVQYRVADVQEFLFKVRQPERFLRATAESVLRQALARRPLLADHAESARERDAEILTRGRGTLEQQIRADLQAQADALGLGLQVLPQGVCLEDVHPPLVVVPAFRDVASAFKEKERLRNEAEAYQRDKVIKAAGEPAWRMLATTTNGLDDARWAQLKPQLAGEAAAELNAARAFAAAREDQARGDAASFAARAAARATAPELTDWRLYTDAVSESLPGRKKLILDVRSTGRRHLLLGIPAQLAPLTVPEQTERMKNTE